MQNKFGRITIFKPAWDKRNPEPSKNYGIHPVHCLMVLKGKKGAVHFSFATGMLLDSTMEDYIKNGIAKYEMASFGHHYLNKPMGFDVGYHSPKPMFDGQEINHPTKMRVAKGKKILVLINPPYGDGIWYQIQQFNSDTSLTLVLPVVNAPNITGSTTYTIGQLPLLSEDFHDMIVYGALMVYFSTIVKDPDKYKAYKDLYKERLELLKDYAGTKNVNVDLEAEPSAVNPNLFIFSQN